MRQIAIFTVAISVLMCVSCDSENKQLEKELIDAKVQAEVSKRKLDRKQADVEAAVGALRENIAASNEMKRSSIRVTEAFQKKVDDLNSQIQILRQENIDLMEKLATAKNSNSELTNQLNATLEAASELKAELAKHQVQEAQEQQQVDKEKRVKELIDEAKKEFAKNKNRANAFKKLAAAYRLKPDDYQTHKALRDMLINNEMTYDAVGALRETNSSFIKVVVVDFVEAAKEGSASVEIFMPDRIYKGTKSSAKLSWEMANNLPEKPSKYLSGEIVQLDVSVSFSGVSPRIFRVNKLQVLSK